MAGKGCTFVTNVQGASLVRRLRGSATFTPGATGAGPIRVSLGTITVLGARFGDFARAAGPAAMPAGCHLQAEVTAVDTVTVFVINEGVTQTPATGIYQTVVEHDV